MNQNFSMNNPYTTASQPSKGAFHDARDAVNSKAAALADQLSTLRARLEFVMRPSNPAPQTGAVKEVTVHGAATSQLYELSDHLNVCLCIAEDILVRLEI